MKRIAILALVVAALVAAVTAHYLFDDPAADRQIAETRKWVEEQRQLDMARQQQLEGLRNSRP